MTTVNWTKDGSIYLIESREHLLQLMNQGSLYTDTGSSISYTGNQSYRQTVDIDLIDVQSFIEPIFGTSAVTSANGSYDGGNFAISNWSYSKTNKDCIGLFGYSYDGVIENVTLKGVWNIDVEANISTGFLLGQGGLDSEVFNCHGIFDDGTTLLSASNSGGMIGHMRSSKRINSVSISGTMSFTGDGNYVGGVVGNVIEVTTVYLLRNTARMSNLQGTYVGGILGQLWNSAASILLNYMIGNISSTSFAAGIIGSVTNRTTGRLVIQRCVNSMTGDITSTYGAGMIGSANLDDRVDFEHMYNYMTGDVSRSGIVGRVIFQSTGTNPSLYLYNSVVAMNGHVIYAVGSPTGFSGAPRCLVDTSFGMTFTATNDIATETFTQYNELFPDLPMIGTTNRFYNIYWDFVFGNLSGKPEYSEYTHLSIHQREVSTPFPTTFEAFNTGDTYLAYGTFSNLGDSEMFINENLVVVDTQATRIFNSNGVQVFPPPPMMLLPRSINIVVDINEVPGAIGYRVTQVAGNKEVTAKSKSDDPLQVNVKSLVPETQYTLKLYVDSGAGYVLTSTQSATTLPDNNDNYMVADFLEDGVFRIEDFSTDTREKISSQMNTLFTTGDRVKISTRTKSDLLARFVNTGGEVTTEEESILVPFDESSGAAQTITLSLSDNVTTVAVNYDDTTNTIAIGSDIYGTGDSFVVDGKKCTVLDFEN